jgi:cytochrome c551/c552
MEEQYAKYSKKVALFCGVIALIVFSSMIYPLLQTPPEPERYFACGTSSFSIGTKGYLGKLIFNNNCASCHNKNMKDILTGPALHDWQKYIGSEENLWLFLTNKKGFLKSKPSKAYLKLQKEFAPTQCTSFSYLSLDDVKSLAIYMKSDYQ